MTHELDCTQRSVKVGEDRGFGGSPGRGFLKTTAAYGADGMGNQLLGVYCR